MKRVGLWLALLVALTPLTGLAAQASSGWQVYTTANGLNELSSYVVEPDGAGGVWVGHQSGGRGIYHAGGLSHIRADGSSQIYRMDEPFKSCSSVDALALAPDNTLWMQLSGYHDYGATDHQQACGQNYGLSDSSGRFSRAIGFIGADGVPHMLPKEQLPPDLIPMQFEYTVGLAVDALGRPWLSTKSGAVVREPDGQWRVVPVWGADSSGTTAIRVQGATVALASGSGDVATIAIHAGQPDQIMMLPRPSGDRNVAISDLAFGPDGLAVVTGQHLYQQNANGGWAALVLPGERAGEGEQIFGQHLDFVGGTFWLSAPQYGLHRLELNQWIKIPAYETPLPNDAIFDISPSSPTTLLIGTDRGAATLDTNSATPDSTAARQAFDALWRRTNLNSAGTWVWGPRAWAERYEAYRESPGGYRFVRYYDKTRMEVSDPRADQNAPWYVTNGLLVVEMVRGQAQLSDDPARSNCPYYVAGGQCPSGVPVAGDFDPQIMIRSPSYGEFGPFLLGVEPRLGARVGTALVREFDYSELKTDEQPALATAATTLAYFDETTQHNIPQIFWDHMRAQPADWLYAFGRPITEAYWIRARVGGTEQWVLVQLFERRTLTYTPGNSPAWQVEMGNVGQHYFAWRYAGYDNPPWAQ